jgi:hypothetical protein
MKNMITEFSENVETDEITGRECMVLRMTLK